MLTMLLFVLLVVRVDISVIRRRLSVLFSRIRLLRKIKDKSPLKHIELTHLTNKWIVLQLTDKNKMLSLRQDDLLINKQIQNVIIVYFEWNQEFLTKKLIITINSSSKL